jgi:hypothetical protein
MSGDLSRTVGATAWARAFVETLTAHPDTADPHSIGFMAGWFANAIEAGRASVVELDVQRYVMFTLGTGETVAVWPPAVAAITSGETGGTVLRIDGLDVEVLQAPDVVRAHLEGRATTT